MSALFIFVVVVGDIIIVLPLFLHFFSFFIVIIFISSHFFVLHLVGTRTTFVACKLSADKIETGKIDYTLLNVLSIILTRSVYQSRRKNICSTFLNHPRQVLKIKMIFEKKIIVRCNSNIRYNNNDGNNFILTGTNKFTYMP